MEFFDYFAHLFGMDPTQLPVYLRIMTFIVPVVFIVLEVLSASPFRFQVECIAESDTPTNIHVWNFPKSYNGWHRFDNNKTERLSIKKENLVSTLTEPISRRCVLTERNIYGQ